MAGPNIPRGRKLSDDTLTEYAHQVLGVLKMWGFSRADAYRCIFLAKAIIEHPKIKDDWGDPLDGSGIHTDKAVEGGIMKAEENGSFSFGKFDKRN